MQQFRNRFVLFLGALLLLGGIALLLSQLVTYKPWGVADSQRERYDELVSQLEKNAEIKQTAVKKPRPIFTAENLVRDFGWVSQGEVREASFKFGNSGDRPLEMSIHRVGHDCVTAELDRQQIMPGESASCSVQYTRFSDLKFDKVLVVLKTNDVLNPTVHLAVESKLKEDLVIPPKLSFDAQDIADPDELSFIIYSQLHPEFEVKSVTSDQADHEVNWTVVPAPPADQRLDDQAVASAYSLVLSVSPTESGTYQGKLDVKVQFPGDEAIRSYPVAYNGKVRPPIGFYGPELDKRLGIDFGSLEGGVQHDFFVTVRSRADKKRKIEVLDHEPKALETELIATKIPGAYKLRISVPADCPNLQYNLDTRRGYVKVGDPNSPAYSSWLPVYLSVADTQ